MWMGKVERLRYSAKGVVALTSRGGGEMGKGSCIAGSGCDGS